MRSFSGLDPSRIRERFLAAREAVESTARGVGRDPAEVEILVAVKYVAVEELEALAEAGIELLGENRAQELVAKAAAYPGVFEWDFIGHLQSRKVKLLTPAVRLIHSVSSHSALQQLGRFAPPDYEVLVEVNLSEEQNKSGISPAELGSFLATSPVRVGGLMTMPPRASDPEESRPYFSALCELANRYSLKKLSMGTSQDYLVAVEEGATTVRLGSTLYGTEKGS